MLRYTLFFIFGLWGIFSLHSFCKFSFNLQVVGLFNAWVIFLDTDTIVLKDLTEFYTLNFENKYILGRLDTLADELDSFGNLYK